MAHTTDSSVTSRVPILEGVQNYSRWRMKLNIEAMRLGIDDHLYEPPPTEPQPITLAADSGNAAAVQKRNDEIDAHKIAVKKAASLVAQTLGDAPLSIVGALLETRTFTARTLLTKLEERFKDTNKVMTAFTSLKKLFGTRYEDGADMQLHINAVRDLLQVLNNLGVKFDDQLCALILLLSLPDTTEWDVFQTPLLAPVTDKNPLTFAQVENALLSRVARAPDASANAVKASTSSQKYGKTNAASGKGEKQCAYHGRCSHDTADCNDFKEAVAAHKTAKRDARSSGGGGKKKKDGAAAHQVAKDDATSGDDEEEAHVTLSAAMIKKLDLYFAGAAVPNAASSGEISRVTILDTGASATICPHRSWFKPASYKAFETPKRVRFGDNSFTDALGEGQIVLRTVVNKQHYELTISGVLFVPRFKLTLISVSSLDAKGLESRFSHGRCRVLKGTQCLLTGERRRGLYHIEGTALEFRTDACPRPQPESAVRTDEHAHAARAKAPKAGKVVEINLMHRRMAPNYRTPEV